MEKTSSGIGITALFLLLVGAGGLSSCSSKVFGDALFEQQLIAASNDQNKKLPMMIDKDTRWDSTMAGPGKNWVYLYTLVSPESKNVTGKQINDVLGSKIRNSVCTMKDMEAFVKNEVTLKYKYQDSTGRFIGEVVVTPQDCQKAIRPN